MVGIKVPDNEHVILDGKQLRDLRHIISRTRRRRRYIYVADYKWRATQDLHRLVLQDSVPSEKVVGVENLVFNVFTDEEGKTATPTHRSITVDKRVASYFEIW